MESAILLLRNRDAAFTILDDAVKPLFAESPLVHKHYMEWLQTVSYASRQRQPGEDLLLLATHLPEGTTSLGYGQTHDAKPYSKDALAEQPVIEVRAGLRLS